MRVYGGEMDKEQKRDLVNEVHHEWAKLYANDPSFDDDNPTPEQHEAYARVAAEMGLPIVSDRWAKAVASMSTDELNDLRSMYRAISL